MKCKCKSYNSQEDYQTDESVILKVSDYFDFDGSSSGNVCIDKCIEPVIKALWENKIWTIGSCCGHNGQFGNPSIIFENDLNCDKVKKIKKIIRSVDDRDFDIMAWKLTNLKFMDYSFDNFWDFLCTELEILGDAEKCDIVKEYGRRITSTINTNLMKGYELAANIINYVGNYLGKYGQVPMMSEICRKFNISHSNLAIIKNKIDGVSHSIKRKTYPYGRFNITRLREMANKLNN